MGLDGQLEPMDQASVVSAVWISSGLCWRQVGLKMSYFYVYILLDAVVEL